jgi:ABC-type siderophore export system fused ATPase/permease subunit
MQADLCKITPLVSTLKLSDVQNQLVQNLNKLNLTGHVLFTCVSRLATPGTYSLITGLGNNVTYIGNDHTFQQPVTYFTLSVFAFPRLRGTFQ